MVDAVLAPHGVQRRWELTRGLPKRAYCVQYHETDLAFVLRMLAEEGIFFRFDHPEVDGASPHSREVLVLGDAAEKVPPIAGVERLPLRESIDGDALRAEGAHVSAFRARRVIAATQVLLRDYDFVHPRFEQRSLTEPLVRSARPDLDGRLPDRSGVYEHKMEYEEPDLQPHDASRHLEQLRASASVHEGETRCARMRPGRSFTLTEGEPSRVDGRYTVTRVDHEGRVAELAAAGDRGLYRNRFACVRAEVPFRPPRPERRLRQVTETATVVGPASEEIHADAHGRVRVQFHWDLDGQHDERSSCWLRASQPWAGPGWGFQFIPRIGMEVVVTFLGGDLDRPLITGTVFNAINSPSFPIPSEVTRSGIRTRSSPGGGGFNEISFEDAKGAEQIHVRAERDLDEVVLVDHTTAVGHDQSISVTGNQSTVVLGAQSVAATVSRTVHVEGPHSVTTRADRADVVHGDHDEEIVGNQTRRIRGVRTETVVGDALQVVQGMLGETIEGPATRHIGTAERPESGEIHAYQDLLLAAGETVRVRGGSSIVLECGESSIELTPEGIRLRGRDIRTVATEQASMQSRGGAGPAVVATDQIEIVAKEIHLFGESSRLSLTKEAELTSDKKAVVHGAGAGLGLAGGATLAGGKIIVAGKGATLVLDAEAKLDGALVKLNCGGEGGGVSVEDRDPKLLDTPRDQKTKKLSVRILGVDRRPMLNKKYLLTVEGASYGDGKTTGSEGEIEHDVPEHASVGQLTVWVGAYPDGERLQWKVDIEPKLPEPDTVPGARIRLSNLGYYQGPPVEEIDERLGDAIRRFQTDVNLPITGRLDPVTALRILEIHGD
jgi:type VI secretion system secreted protein VgrG